MQNIKKYFMTLALLLTAVTGAWAQSSLGVKELAVPATWNGVESPVTAGDLPGFKASTYDEAKTWTGAPAEGYAVLFYAFDGEKASYVFFIKGSPNSNITTPYNKDLVFNNSTSQKFYYTAEPTEWELTSKDGKNWILDKMPANNIELQVEYYAESNLFLGKEALANKANISVLNGSTAVTFDDEGKSANTVTEGNTVTAKFTGTKKVIGVKAEKKAASLIVNPVVGQIIGSDGKNYDANATLPDGVTKVAMIAYVGNDAETSTTYNHGLALALEDVSVTEINWCSQTNATCLSTQYVDENESKTRFNDLAGIANTDALVNHTGHTHDAASAARDYNSGTHPTGTSAWFLPSAGQWDKMATAAGGYANLITNAGLQGGNLSAYWSSTEYDSEHAWFFFPQYSGWNINNKGGGNLVRACLAF